MATDRDDVTVVCWASKEFAVHSEGLRSDCKKFGYRFALYSRNERFFSGVEASLYHPDMALRAIEEHGTVLFLDAECRLVRPLPTQWRAPLISVRSPAQPFHITYNSGTMLLDRGCRPWIEAWSRVIDRWDLSGLRDDDYIRWPGDLCDEVALHAALAVYGIRPQTVALEYVDRGSDAPISRGYWASPATVIQHPTLHHWPDVVDPVESKKLFWQNYPDDPVPISRCFEQPGALLRTCGWIFDFDRQCYAPEAYWIDHPRPWIVDAVVLTSAQR